MMNLEKIKSLINNNKHFLISTHVHPDPDALSSELVMANFLRAQGKQVTIINEEKVQDRYLFLEGSRQIQAYPSRGIFYDAAIVLDCGDLERVGKVKDIFQGSKPLVNVDHHRTNKNFGTINIVDPGASSTAEVVYEFLRGMRFILNKKLAKLLYLGILTDTGSFRYENTTFRTHEIVSCLLKLGFRTEKLFQQVYERIPLKDFVAFGKLMSHFEVFENGRLIYVGLPKKVVAKFSDRFDLRDTIFRYLRAVGGVEVIAILTEMEDGKTRLNLRSLGKVDVSKIACLFKGGGHRAASGGTFNVPLKEAKNILLSEVKNFLI